MKCIHILVAVVLFFVFFVHSPVFCTDFFEEGTKKFRENNPTEAAPLLAKAISMPGTDPRAWVYLGTAYQQLNRLDEAVGIFKKGLTVSGANSSLLYVLLGDTYFMQEKYTFAEEMYSKAVNSDAYYAVPVLNRANTRIKLNKLHEASDDYTTYLTLDPDTPQRDNILKIQGLIAEQFELEQMQAAQAAADKKIEEERIATLQKEAEERRQQILNEVEESLRLSAGDTTAVSAGAEGVVSYDEESELE